MSRLTFKDLYLDSKRFPKVGDGPFEVPSMVLNKPQFLFGLHVVVLYEDDDEAREELCNGFSVTNQALWNWRREGLPIGRKDQAQALIDDPDRKFRLATNVTLDQLIRPVSGPKRRRDKNEPLNEAWLNLLSDIETGKYDGLTRDDISKIIKKYTGPPLPIWSPYKWGWDTGGVPPSYARSVWKALIELKLHKKMKLSEEDFIEYCETNYRAPTRMRQRGSEDEPVKITKKNAAKKPRP